MELIFRQRSAAWPMPRRHQQNAIFTAGRCYRYLRKFV